MKAKVYNMSGNIVGEIELSPRVFASHVKPELVHEVMIGMRANRRAPIAHTKTRGEVRGGGRKPWRQKGTGRARHGSIRSPIWIGGGVVGGPRSDRNFAVKINRKVRRKALLMALGDRAQSDRVIVLDTLTLPEAKTKQLAGFLAKLPMGKKALVILPKSDASVFRASRNLGQVKTVTANALGMLDVLGHDTLLMPQATLSELEKLYGK